MLNEIFVYIITTD